MIYEIEFTNDLFILGQIIKMKSIYYREYKVFLILLKKSKNGKWRRGW